MFRYLNLNVRHAPLLVRPSLPPCSYISNGGGNAETFVVLSNVMLAVQGFGFFFFLLIMIYTNTKLVRMAIREHLNNKRKEKMRLIVLAQMKDQSREWHELVLGKKYANRWLNRVFGRPLKGWPRLGPVTEDEKAVLVHAVEEFIADEQQKGWALKMIRDDITGPLASLIYHHLPDNFDR